MQFCGLGDKESVLQVTRTFTPSGMAEKGADQVEVGVLYHARRWCVYVVLTFPLAHPLGGPSRGSMRFVTPEVSGF